VARSIPVPRGPRACPVRLHDDDIGSKRGKTMEGKKIWDGVLRKVRGKEGTIISVLRTVPIFQGLAFSELKKIEIIVHERTFMPDEVIFHEKQPGVGMYIIKMGRVRLAKTINEKKVKIAELKENEFFGEMSLLEDYPRSAEATAVERTEVLGIFRPDLFDLIASNPRLGSKILLGLSQRLASRLRETTEMRLKGME
jgi:CRP/FNR family cyclic AMP-dependent transcriptional regulator